ncbi:chemotaxis protein CheW [bacterium]|nr:chemotaxis protein CheW [bacterium]
MDAVRVPISKIDMVAEYVGELLISLSLLQQCEDMIKALSPEISEKFSNINLTMDQLQFQVLSMRLFPIKSVYDKLKRQVRDLVKKSGKEIRFETFGEEVEVDKLVIDAIFAPLTHLIRNSIDHGIESSDERDNSGKTEIGLVSLVTENRGDSVMIRISDDGKGLDRDAILNKAISQGLIQENSNPSDSELFNFIFHPGFSTAKKVTEISGRGVGMDVVRTSIDALHGSIKTLSQKGQGTAFEITLPFSTPIIEGLVTRLGESRFIWPVLSVHHVLTPMQDDIKRVYREQGMFILFQGESVPLIVLSKLFNMPKGISKPEESVVIICEYNSRLYGIMVDEILFKQKVVTKKLDQQVCINQCIKTGTILGNGSVGFILNPKDVIKMFLGEVENEVKAVV